MAAQLSKPPLLLSIGVYVFIGLLLLSIYANIYVTNSNIAKQSTKEQSQVVKTPAQQVAPTQEPPQNINKTTVLSFSPESTLAAPKSYKAGDILTYQIVVEPGQNLVSFINTEINYDATKLAPEGPNPFTPEGPMTSLLEGPKFTQGKIAVTMSIGANPQNAIDKTTRVATIKFRALDVTAPNRPTSLTFGGATNVLSLAADDNASDNVLLDTRPALINIR